MLTSIFAIDLVAYSIMHNHYHLVIRVENERSNRWTDEEVCRRWGRIFSMPDEPEARLLVPVWRTRLASISWFMRCLNEPLARRANKEDDCTGHFWEGRFKLQALLDDTALYKCMTYVDLNPIRAGIAATPETSDHTSIKARLEGRDEHLVPLLGSSNPAPSPLPMTHAEYARLVDWTGRRIAPGKAGHIAGSQPVVLDRWGFGEREWFREIRHYGKWYYRAVGSLAAMELFRARLGQRWLKGISHSRPQSA